MLCTARPVRRGTTGSTCAGCRLLSAASRTPAVRDPDCAYARGGILNSTPHTQVLCDRLGIFVDGQLVCVGAPKEITARYGGYLVSLILANLQLKLR